MERKVFVKRIKHTGLLLLLLVSSVAFSQPDCRSIIGAHLTPIGESSLSWATEGTVAAGFMPDREIANWSVYGALDYSKNKWQFYFEGTYKDWYNSASNPDGEAPQTTMEDYNKPTRYNWGMREGYLKYGDQSNFIKTGIQSLKSTDYMLFDERLLGVTAAKSIGAIQLNAALGTVSQRIARFQDVCGNRHIYNIVHRSQYNFVSDTPGESNFGGLFLTWKPSQKSSDNKLDDDEFAPMSNDGFETFDEFSSNEFGGIKSKQQIKLKESGLFFYEEFGTAFHEYKYYSGVFAQFQIPLEINLKTELIDQYILNDHAIALYFQLEKEHTWSNGSTSIIDVSYLGKMDVDTDAHFYPAFSNLFAGEVLRLDAIDLPLVSGTFKHYLSGKNKITMQLNAVRQINRNRSQEIDLIAGIKLLKHVRLTAIGSYLSSELLTDNYWMGKMEVRIAF